jgi:SSS family solute:Na+ symporter/sodium/proline symporter
MLIAASMSTLSSLVLISASTLTEDFIKGVLHKETTERKNLILMKLLCVLFIAISVILALVPNKIIILLSLSWGTIASAFMAPYLYALYGKTNFKISASLSSAAGVVTMLGCVLIWGKAYSTYFGCLAIIVSFLVLFIGVKIESMRNKNLLADQQLLK